MHVGPAVHARNGRYERRVLNIEGIFRSHGPLPIHMGASSPRVRVDWGDNPRMAPANQIVQCRRTAATIVLVRSDGEADNHLRGDCPPAESIPWPPISTHARNSGLRRKKINPSRRWRFSEETSNGGRARVDGPMRSWAEQTTLSAVQTPGTSNRETNMSRQIAC